MRRTLSTIGVTATVAAALALTAPAASAASCGPVGPFECGATAREGAIEVSFVDKWAGVGFETWTIDSSISKGTVGFIPPGGTSKLELTDKYCFNKYNFDVTVSGDGIGGSTGTEKDCGSRSGGGDGQVTNSGKVIGRASPLGRWIWFSHNADLRVTNGSQNLFVGAYKRSSPNGGDV